MSGFSEIIDGVGSWVLDPVPRVLLLETRSPTLLRSGWIRAVLVSFSRLRAWLSCLVSRLLQITIYQAIANPYQAIANPHLYSLVFDTQRGAKGQKANAN
jgi:hypothetical protein